jgi:hypothetical protein
LIIPQASFGDPVVDRIRLYRDVVVEVVLDFLLNKPSNADAFVVDEVLVDGVVVIRAEIASELGFCVVVFFPNKKRLMVSITS